MGAREGEDDRLLWDDPWLQMKQVVDPEHGVKGYTYSHEVRCHGHIVAVLPVRAHASGQLEFCIRREITPCWGMTHNWSSLTGGCDLPIDEESPEVVAIRELKEESGYEAKVHELINLGTCFGTKSTDTIYHLFAVDVGDKEPGEAAGDGTPLDTEGIVDWFQLPESPDPIVALMMYRLSRQMDKAS